MKGGHTTGLGFYQLVDSVVDKTSGQDRYSLTQAIFEIGEERGWHYIVTEFIDGQTLRHRLASGSLALGEALEIGEESVLRRLTRLSERSAVSRIGATLRPNTAGASTLAAVVRDRVLERRRAGDLYDLAASRRRMAKRAVEWNLARIVVRRARIEHWLNGERAVAIERGSSGIAM